MPDMNQPPGPPPPQPLPGSPIPPPAPRKKSGCFGCLMGCLVIVILAVVACGGAGYYFYSTYQKKFDAASAEFKSQGFTEIKRPDMILTASGDKLDAKTILNAPSVMMNGQADGDLAILTYSCKVNG